MIDTAKAAEPILFGSPIRVTGTQAYVSTVKDMNGIAKRPPIAVNDSHYGVGENVVYQVDGEVLGLIDNQPRWLDLRGGKIV